MAIGEDRPIIVSGGDQMINVTLPPSSKLVEGAHNIQALSAAGPFKTIVFRNKQNEVEFSRPASGFWTITIE